MMNCLQVEGKGIAMSLDDSGVIVPTPIPGNINMYTY